MKKLIVGILSGLFAIAVFATAYQSGGGRGGYFTASTTAQQITMVTTNGMDGAEVYAVCVSIQNLGTNVIFIGHDFPNAAMFNKAVTDMEAIPIEYMEYFDLHGARIQSIWVKTTNSTSAIKIAAY